MIIEKGSRGGGFVARVAPMRISCRILVEKLKGKDHLGGGGYYKLERRMLLKLVLNE